MPNSDNTYGTFNKQTNIYSQQVGEPFTLTWDGGSETETPVGVTFSTVDEAKNWFFTADALAVFNECCTTLEWALVDNDKLKATFDFGTKGGSISEADDWAEQFRSRKTTLVDANNFFKGLPAVGVVTTSSNEHLF